MRPINLVSLTHALMAAELGSFNRAATKLGVRQSAVSRRIKSFEDDLGVSIFKRDRNNIRVTAPGRLFLEEAKRILESLDSAAECARAAGKGIVGEIYIGVEAPLSDIFILSLLQEFRDVQHQVSLRIIEGSKSENLVRLERGEVDFAFVHCRPIGEDPDLENPIFDNHDLWSTKLYVAIPKDHYLTQQEIISLGSLRTDNILVGNYGCELTINDYKEALRTCISEKINIERQLVCREALKNFVGLGLGVTFTGAPHSFKDNKDLMVKPIQGIVERLKYSGAWLTRNDNPALRKFINLAKIRSKMQKSLMS